MIAKCIPVVLTSGKSGDAVSQRLNSDSVGVVTMKELIYVKPRSGDGLDALRDAICRGRRRREEQNTQARAPIVSVPESSLAPESAVVVAPSDGETVARNRVSAQ